MNSKQKNLALVVLILVLVLFYIFSGGSVGISLDFGESELTLSASDYDWLIPYEEIDSLALTDLPEPGTVIDGSETRTLCCGTWKNETYGEYTLCADPGIGKCIVIRMKTGDVYVINYENSDSTAQLHQMFTDLLRSKS